MTDETDSRMQLLDKLISLVERHRSDQGDEWTAAVREFEPKIRTIMRQAGTDNPFKSLTPLLVQLQAEDDLEAAQMLLAVAAEMVIREQRRRMENG